MKNVFKSRAKKLLCMTLVLMLAFSAMFSAMAAENYEYGNVNTKTIFYLDDTLSDINDTYYDCLVYIFSSDAKSFDEDDAVAANCFTTIREEKTVKDVIDSAHVIAPYFEAYTPETGVIAYKVVGAEDYEESGFHNRMIKLQPILESNEGVDGGTSQIFTITYDLDNGTNAEANPDTYTTGDEITLENPTKPGYTFEGWYLDENFKTPAEEPQITADTTGDITFYAKWSKIENNSALKTEKDDVKPLTNSFLAAIASGRQVGAYLTGYGDGTIRADAGMTRAEAAAIFSRIHKDFSPFGFYVPDYDDVNVGDWYAKYVGFIQKKGIADVLSGEFRPNDFITRAEFCTMLANCLALKGSDNESPFTDVTDSRIVALSELGFINGYEDGSFRPWLGITRAEVAKIVNLVLGRNYDGSHLANPYKDLNKSHWAYAELLKASAK